VSLHVAHMNNALQLSLQGIVFRASDRRQSIDTDCAGPVLLSCTPGAMEPLRTGSAQARDVHAKQVHSRLVSGRAAFE
jgi:hypothetical protein